jgi:hypothetical protein
MKTMLFVAFRVLDLLTAMWPSGRGIGISVAQNGRIGDRSFRRSLNRGDIHEWDAKRKRNQLGENAA